MNFRPELAAKVLDGSKTVTRRLASSNPRSPWYEGGCGLKVGRDYAVCPGRGKPQLGRVVVTAVELMRLGRVHPAEALREGFESVAEFEEAFAGINGACDPDWLVWRIEFRREAADDPERR